MTGHSRKKRTNLRDVARVAGVSVATVSRVLNTPDVVNAKTRQKVENIIAELGFVRNAAARSINSGRTKIVGALVPTLASDIFALTLAAIEDQLAALGLSLVVATTKENSEVEARKAQELLEIGVEGLLLTGRCHSDELHDLVQRMGTPAIAMSCYDAGYHLPTIGYDNQNAARQAAAYLQKTGHRRVAFVHGPAAMNDRTQARIAGVQAENLDVTCFETEFTAQGGHAAARRALGHSVPFDAFLCASDVLAYGVIAALQSKGVAVPRDASVVGMQDLPGARVTLPKLTTVCIPAQEMGRRAAQALANWIEQDQRPAPLCLPTELILRDSVRLR